MKTEHKLVEELRQRIKKSLFNNLPRDLFQTKMSWRCGFRLLRTFHSTFNFLFRCWRVAPNIPNALSHSESSEALMSGHCRRP